MKARRFVALLLLLLLPLTARAQEEVPSPHVATFDIEPAELTGFESMSRSLQLAAPQGTLVSQSYAPGWEFIAVAATWQKELPPESIPSLEVRVSDDGQSWSEWSELPVVDDDRPEHSTATFTELLFIQGREVQLRASLQNPSGEPLVWEGLRLTVIDGRPGPTVDSFAAQSPAVANAEPTIISRQAWGANESYRFTGSGEEIWPREYATPRALFVHHTATSTSAPDPAAAMRSIYYYHTVTLGWGDIGYHFVIDQYGNIYQGRYGTEWSGKLVVGGHALGYNLGTLGVSMIGNYTSTSPGSAAMNSLKELLAWRAARYGINPLARVWLTAQGSNPDRWFTYALLGHRDSHDPARTSCPGDALYAHLPEIRADVASRLSDIAPTIQLISPVENTLLEGSVMLQANASGNVVRMDYFLDGSLIGSSQEAPWTLAVDAASLPAGSFTLRATGSTMFGSSVSEERHVQVAPVQWATPTPSASATPTASATPLPSSTPTATTPPTATATPTSTSTPTVRATTTRTLPTAIATAGSGSFLRQQVLYQTRLARRLVARTGTVRLAQQLPTQGAARLFLPLLTTIRAQPQCREMVANSTFHSNLDWLMLMGQYAARYADEAAWSAPRSVRVGMAPGDNYESFSSARLPLTLPSEALSATLTLRYLPETEGAADTDRQYIGILDRDGVYVASVVPSALRNESAWQSASYDLQPFLGQTIYLYIGAKNDGVGSSTRLYVDDVQVTLCTMP